MQEETRARDQVRVRSRQPRGEHDAKVHVGPCVEGGGRWDWRAGAVGAGADRLHAGAGERVDAQVAQGGEHQDQGLTSGARGGRNMPEVYNWQLGRKMLYPYEERHPKWQFTFVFNINRCIACQTCSMADKATSMRALVDGNDKSGFSAAEPWKTQGSSLPEHETFFFYLQRICNHCTYPGCLAACPRKAIYKRPEDGIVLIDQNRCRGYKKCVEQCPYKKPMYRGTTRVSEKCIACYPRVEGKDPLTGGEPMETRCMAACVGKIRLQGLNKIGEDGLWAEDRWHPLYYAIRVEQVALPLYPQWGTEPNGYYIPPRWSPRGYIRQMFGPGVDNAIDRYIVPSRELLAVLQLWRTTQQIIFRYDVIPGPKVFETQIHGRKFEMYNDTVLAFNKSGKEVVRIQVEEPIYIRPAERVQWL